MNIKLLTVSALLASISAISQIIHLGYQSPQWGMWIDVVSFSWIIAFFLYGARASFIVSLLGALIITLFAPDTWLGASMKWIATMPLWTVLYIWQQILHKKPNYYSNFKNIFIPLFIAIIIRSLIVVPLNYFYAIPIWTGLSSIQAMSLVPWYIIFIFNSIQAVIDIVFAWIVVYRFKLIRYAKIL